MTQLPDTRTETGQREASVMLARMMGIYLQLFSDMAKFRLRGDDVFVSVYPHGWYHGMTEDEAWKYFPNLYAPANMALAWSVINWALRSRLSYGLEDWLNEGHSLTEGNSTKHAPRWWIVMYISAPEAVKMCLDKIIAHALYMGMNEVKE